MHPDLDNLIRKEFGLGAREAPQRIYHAQDPRLPQMSFEWHLSSQKVYRIDLPGRWADGEWVPAPAGAQAKGHCVAEHCLTHGQFVGFVQTFCRGYLLAVCHRDSGALDTYAPVRLTKTDSCPVR
jgi:hypothetical protein